MFLDGFFSSVGSFFHQGYNYVSEKVSDAYHFVSDKIHSVTSIPSSVVTTVYQDAKSVVSSVGHTINHIVDKGSDSVNVLIKGAENVVTHGQDTIGNSVNSLGNSLSMPLVLVGAAGALYFLTKK